MAELYENYLTKPQAIQKYTFLSENLVKNWLFKNVGGFREKVVHKVGRRIFLNETALLKFIADHKEGA